MMFAGHMKRFLSSGELVRRCVHSRLATAGAQHPSFSSATSSSTKDTGSKYQDSSHNSKRARYLAVGSAGVLGALLGLSLAQESPPNSEEKGLQSTEEGQKNYRGARVHFYLQSILDRHRVCASESSIETSGRAGAGNAPTVDRNAANTPWHYNNPPTKKVRSLLYFFNDNF